MAFKEEARLQEQGEDEVRLAEAYEGLVNRRDDFLHKLSRFYTGSYDVIYVEELNIRGMARNRSLA